MSKLEINGEGEFKVIFDGVGVVHLPPIDSNERKLKVEYSVKAAEGAMLHGQRDFTLSSGLWVVSLGVVLEDYVRGDPDGLFEDMVVKKNTVIISPIRLA